MTANLLDFGKESPAQQSILGADPDLAQKLRMAQLLLSQQPKPIKYWHDAIPNSVNQLMGALLGRQSTDELKTQTTKLQTDTAAMLEGGKPFEYTLTDTGEHKTQGGGYEGSIGAGLRTHNPALLPTIHAMQLEQFKNQAALTQTREVARIKALTKSNAGVKLGPNDTLHYPDNSQPDYTAPGKPTAQYEPVLDAQGQPLAQRNSLTGKLETDPRVKPPVQTYEPVTDALGNPLAQRNTTTGELKKDPSAKKPVSEQFRKSWRGLEDLTSGLDSYENRLNISGTEVIRGPSKAKLKTVFTDVLMGAKELYGLGALQAQDMVVIQGLLADPTSWDAAVTPNSAYQAQIGEVRKILARAKQNLLKAYNNPPGFNSDAPATPSPGGSPTDTGGAQEIHFDQNGKPIQ